MKHRSLLFLLLICLGIMGSLQAQPISFPQNSPADISTRSSVDLTLWPFVHGVASGDPLTDRVIIWTRATPGFSDTAITVTWEMATDTGMVNVVQSGTIVTDSLLDYTVKIDVTGLTANKWYYYRFYSGGRKSPTGRTRTAPAGDVDSLRFAVVSCSDYVDGYFHGYRRLAQRNDIDAVIHLGDYIYENGSGGSIGRPHDPPFRITELEDYRQRYSQYRLDADLRCVHQMYPFINVWDDHESANNSWTGGAEAHDFPADGFWEHRKRMAAKAYREWIPIRQPDPADTIRIYRSMEWGNLLKIIMLDTRLIGRDSQVTGNAIYDSTRTILGAQQLSWLSQEMQNSSAQWQVVGQQVMMAPLEIPFFGPFATDSWDGYQAERNRFYDTVLTKNIDNLVVLTGDIHTAWANDLESDNGDPVGVEFVCSSITTQNAPFPVSQGIIQSANPHIKYAKLDGHGYYILDVNKNRAQADYFFVGDITDSLDNSETSGQFWFTNDGDGFLTQSTSFSVPRSDFPIQPSKDAPNPLSTESEVPDLTVIGAYPNPFWANVVLKFYLETPGEVTTEIHNLQGQKVKEISQGKLSRGLHYLWIEATQLPPGPYLFRIKTGDEVAIRRMVKLGQ